MSSLIAVLAAILVSMWPIAQYYRMVEEGNKRAVVAVTAGQFSMLLGGIKKYIRAHTNDLINDIPVGSSTTVSLATLTAEHDLPAGFTTTNPYNQTWVVYVTQSASGVLDGRVISYGGQTLSPRDAVAIALKAGAQGGYIPPNDLISGLNSGMAVGGGGTWSQSMAGFPNPGAGHLVGLVASADDVNNNPNYLYRVGVPGHDELNTMGVALNMGGNAINNAATVNAVQGMFADDVTVAAGGCAFNAPGTCLYGDGANTALRTKGSVYFQHMDSSAADTLANHASAQATYLGTDNGVATFRGACSPNGAIAASTDGSGALLNCKNGFWDAPGAVTVTEYISVFAGGFDHIKAAYSTKPHDFCVLSASGHDMHDANCSVYEQSGGYWGVFAQTDGNGTGAAACGATCFN